MWSKNKLIKQLGIKYPIIQGPMSGASPPSLVAAVSNTGCLGSLGAAQYPPDQIREAIRSIRSTTDKPFIVNLFVPDNHPLPDAKAIAAMNKLLDPIRRELGIPESPAFKPNLIDFNAQLEVVLEEQVPVFSFTFGILSADIIEKIKAKNIIVFGTATTVHEALLLADSGVDGVVAQGAEAGGHRGSAHDTSIEQAMIGGIALIPQMVDQLKIPVIAAGGIMDGRGIVAALALGADAVQMGTAFLSCPESGINDTYRKALGNSTDESTCLTCSFTGRYLRGIHNELMEKLAPFKDALLPFPYQRLIMMDILNAAKSQGRTEIMMMLSGQAASLCRKESAASLIKDLLTETETVLKSLTL